MVFLFIFEILPILLYTSWGNPDVDEGLPHLMCIDSMGSRQQCTPYVQNFGYQQLYRLNYVASIASLLQLAYQGLSMEHLHHTWTHLNNVYPTCMNWAGVISFLVLHGMVYIIVHLNTNTGRQTPYKSRRIRNNKFNRIKSHHRRDWFRDRMDRKSRLRGKRRKPKPLYHLTIIGQLHLLLAIICIGIESLLKQTKHRLLRVFQSVVCNDSGNNILAVLGNHRWSNAFWVNWIKGNEGIDF
eukprot:scaffold125216_cov65-Cyclotella_meneghiniana.AAC.1